MGRGITTVDAAGGRTRRHWARPMHTEQPLSWPHLDPKYDVSHGVTGAGIHVQDQLGLLFDRGHLPFVAAPAATPTPVPATDEYSSFLWVGPAGQHLTRQLSAFRVLQVQGGLSAFVGQAATAQTLERLRARKRLHEAVDFFRVHGFFSGTGERLYITEAVRALAQRFLKLLPTSIALPQLAPDEDGGLMFYWSAPSQTVVSVDDYRLHCVKNAGTQAAEYFDDVPFEGEAIPAAILAALQ